VRPQSGSCSLCRVGAGVRRVSPSSAKRTILGGSAGKSYALNPASTFDGYVPDHRNPGRRNAQLDQEAEKFPDGDVDGAGLDPMTDQGAS